MSWPFGTPVPGLMKQRISPGRGPPSANQPYALSASTFWSSYFFRAGTNLNGCRHRLFTTPLGQPGQGFDERSELQDTNLRDSGYLPISFNVHRVQWLVREVDPSSDMERLAQAFSRSSRDRMLEHGVLRWDFTTTTVDIGPLWLEHAEQSVQIPERNSFAITLEFGPGAPVLEVAHVVRVCIVGERANWGGP